MKKMYSFKDKKAELYIQIEIDKNIWGFLDNLTYELFDENYMIDDHYRGKIKDNDYFSFNKKGIHLSIITLKNRAHIIIIGLNYKVQKRIKNMILEEFSLEE